MPRRREVPKRDILPDPKFGSVEVSKFVNTLMMSGKKSVAERIVYGAFDLIAAKGGKDPLEVFALAMNNVKPLVEVKSRRVGGANYQVPVEVRPSRRMALAMRWLRESGCRQFYFKYCSTFDSTERGNIGPMIAFVKIGRAHV